MSKSKEKGELWTPADRERLSSTAATLLSEARRCHEAGAPRAALVLLAASFESSLLGRVVAAEEAEVRAARRWPSRPSRLRLGELVDLAGRQGWLSQPISDEVTGVLEGARRMAARPGAYVRDAGRDPEVDPDDPLGVAALLHIVQRACGEVSGALPARGQRSDG